MISKVEVEWNEYDKVLTLYVTLRKDIMSIIKNKTKPDFNKRLEELKKILESEKKYVRHATILVGRHVKLRFNEMNDLLKVIREYGNIYYCNMEVLNISGNKNCVTYNVLNDMINKLEEESSDSIYSDVQFSKSNFKFEYINSSTLLLDCANLLQKSYSYKNIHILDKYDYDLTDVLILIDTKEDYDTFTERLNEFKDTFINIVHLLNELSFITFRIIATNDFYGVETMTKFIKDTLYEAFFMTHDVTNYDCSKGLVEFSLSETYLEFTYTFDEHDNSIQTMKRVGI